MAVAHEPIKLTAPDASGNAYGILVATANIRGIYPAFVKDVDGDWWGEIDVPKDYVSTPKIILWIMANQTSSVVCRMLVLTKATAVSATIDAAGTAETAIDGTLTTTAYRPLLYTFTLSTTPVAGEKMTVKIQHNGLHANDTVAVDPILYKAVFEYTNV